MENERSNNIFLSEGINVLSLFDGISCGQVALNRAGIKVNNYFASEIDKHAIKVTQSNYPNTIQIGDVTKVQGVDLPKIDLLMGGSPCQGFSFSGKQLNFDDPRSKLFFEFVRLIEEVKPKYWLLENVVMKQEYQDVISKHLGVEPIKLNSALTSSQNRVRLYWANFDITEPTDQGIKLEDVIEDVSVYRIPKNYHKYIPNENPKFVDPYNKKAITKNKSSTLRTNVNNGNMWVKVINGYRNLTVSECEKLSNLPIGYTKQATEAQAKKQMGNGWEVGMITHIFNQMSAQADKECGEEKNIITADMHEPSIKTGT